MYCLDMLAIAMELAREDPAYEDVASKFFEHFVYITQAMNNRGGHGISLWDEEDGFYYDVLHLPDEQHHFLKVRSMVGLIPLYAVEVLEPEALEAIARFQAAHAMVPRQCSQRSPSHRNDAKVRARDSPATLHCQPQKTGEDSSLHAG